jgi:hypothetical protein
MQHPGGGNGHDEIGDVKGKGDKIGFKIVFFTGYFQERDQHRIKPGYKPEDEEKNADDGDGKNVISLRPVGERYSCLVCHGDEFGEDFAEILSRKSSELSEQNFRS